MTSTKQMIVQAFSKAFNKYFYNELVVGKLAHSELKQSINKGDEVDITMPGVVRLFDYDGGDLPTAEAATLSTCKVKIDRGKAFHFELSEMEEKMIEANKETPDNMVTLAKDYTEDAIKQFAASVDVEEIVKKRLAREIRDGVQTFQYQINTLQTANGRLLPL